MVFPDGATSHYGWTEPLVGGSVSTWGTKLNDNFEAIDSVVFTNSQGLPRAATGLLEHVILTKDVATSGGAFVQYNGPVGARFVVGIDGATEGSGNTNSNYNIYRYDNAGGFLGTALTINRASGTASFGSALTVAGAV